MKKTVRNVLIVLVIVVIAALIVLMLLKQSEDKLTATMFSNTTGMNMTTTVDITFKNNEADNVTMTYQFDDTNTAATYGQMVQFSYAQDNTTSSASVAQNGNNVVVSGKASDIIGSDQGLTRDDITNQLQSAGFTVK